MLADAQNLPAPDTNARDRARAAFALALGEPPDETKALRMSCDSLGSTLYREVINISANRPETLAPERDRLVRFLAQEEIDAFAAFHLVQLAHERRQRNAA